MTNYTIDSKIFWVTDIQQATSYRDTMLPSVASLTAKYEAVLSDHFEYHLEPINTELFETVFIPCYKRYVVSKSTFYLDEELIYEKLRKNFSDPDFGSYYLLWVTAKENSTAVYGASLFRVAQGKNESKQLVFINKGYDHLITKELRLKASLDYWTEGIVHNFAIEQHCDIIRHGRDKHFRPDPGLFLFKLKMGARPLSGIINQELPLNREDVESSLITDEDIYKNDLSVFFTNPDERGFFQRINLFCKRESSKYNAFVEFEATAQKVGLEIVSHVY